MECSSVGEYATITYLPGKLEMPPGKLPEGPQRCGTDRLRTTRTPPSTLSAPRMMGRGMGRFAGLDTPATSTFRKRHEHGRYEAWR